jgi:hypothetical protein
MPTKSHVAGFVVGVLAVYAYHHWVKPLPGAKASV